jgi:hypothetical protein
MHYALTKQRGVFRIGVMLTALSVIALPVASIATSNGGELTIVDALMWVILAGMGATGIGLLIHARFARILVGVLLLGGLAVAPISLVLVLDDTLSSVHGELGLGLTLALANAIATTALWMWLCFRGIQVLRGVSTNAEILTARLSGGVMATVALTHLWRAVEIGTRSLELGSGEWRWIKISPNGMWLFGFPGWPLWHTAVFRPVLVLLVGPNTLPPSAATMLAGLFGALTALVMIDPHATERGAMTDLAFTSPVLLVGLFPMMLAWWLRDELRGVEPAALAGQSTASDST